MPGRLYGAAAEFMATKYLGQMSEDDTVVTVGTAATSLIGGDPDRLTLLIVNLSGNTAYIGINNDVSAANGIRLGATGGSVSFDANEDGMIPTREIFALGAGAGTNLYVLSMRRFIADRQITYEEGEV
jgi:hypothetical protein|tara:strand:- start:625 stop:1008 length:384 start_codon:yes stop_codon:yes gene_type:complete